MVQSKRNGYGRGGNRFDNGNAFASFISLVHFVTEFFHFVDGKGLHRRQERKMYKFQKFLFISILTVRVVLLKSYSYVCGGWM